MFAGVDYYEVLADFETASRHAMTKIPTNLPPISTQTTQAGGEVGKVGTGVGKPQQGAAAEVVATHVPQTVAGNPLDPNLSLRRDTGGGAAMFAMQASSKMDTDWTDLKPETQRFLQTLGRADDATLHALFDDLTADKLWA